MTEKIQTCDICTKRSICEIKQEISTFVLKHGPRFEISLGYSSLSDWMEFLGGRCREYQGPETKKKESQRDVGDN